MNGKEEIALFCRNTKAAVGNGKCKTPTPQKEVGESIRWGKSDSQRGNHLQGAVLVDGGQSALIAGNDPAAEIQGFSVDIHGFSIGILDTDLQKIIVLIGGNGNTAGAGALLPAGIQRIVQKTAQQHRQFRVGNS